MKQKPSHAARGTPEGVWDTEGRDSILRVTRNTCPLPPIHVSLSRRPWRRPVPAPGVNREGPATPSGSGDSPVHSGWRGRLTVSAPLGRARGRQGVRILPQSAPPPCPARMGGAFPRILQVAFNCLGLCLKPCPERISCSQSIHTCLFRLQRRFIDCVPLGKWLLSSLSERTGQARIKGVRTCLVTPGGHGLPGGGAGRTHLAGGPAENGGGAGSRMDLPVGERRCPRTPDLGDVSLGWD